MHSSLWLKCSSFCPITISMSIFFQFFKRIWNQRKILRFLNTHNWLIEHWFICRPSEPSNRLQVNNSARICTTSVADPGCLTRIPDPKTAIKERGEKKLDVKSFYVATNHKIVNYFSFELLKKKNLGQFSKNYRTFNQNKCQ